MRVAGFAFGLTLLAVVSHAQATEPKSEAQRLFDEAHALARDDNWREACVLLAQSLALEANMTTQFRLADCYEHVGRTASAWEHYTAAAEAAGKAGDKSRQRFAADRAERLAPMVDRIIITVPADVNIEVERDGRVLPRANWGTPLPVDPGEHTVHAWAPGKSSFDMLIKVRGKGQLIRVEVPKLEPALPFRLSQDRAPGSQTTSGPAGAVAEVPAPPAPRPLRSLRPWGIGFGVAGLAALGTGAVLYANASNDAPASTACADGRCTGAVAFMSGGGVALLLGALLFTSSYIEP